MANETRTAPTEPPPDLLTQQEVAALLRAPYGTVRYWVSRGEAPPSFKIGRRRVFRRSSVLEWLADRERLTRTA